MKYKLINLKNKLIFNIIKLLYKFTDRHLYKSISIYHTKDNISGSGIRYYYIDNEPYPVNKCKNITIK